MADQQQTPAGGQGDDRRESGMPGGGQGRKDETGTSGVYPVSAMAGAKGDARVQAEASWGQGERGAAGYADAGGSEPTMVEGQEAVGAGETEPGGQAKGERGQAQ